MRRVEVNNGDAYGKLTIIKEVEARLYNSRSQRQVECKCSCGNVITVTLNGLRTGNTKSCGCAFISMLKKKGTHHMSNTPEYKTWAKIIQRCNNKKSRDYGLYGGRGITVCKEWKDSFQSFFNDMGKRPYGMSIDRVDNDAGYCKSNCRWAKNCEQSQNKRTTKLNPAIVKMLRNGSMSVLDVMKATGCSDACAYAAKNNKTWRNIK